MSTVHLHLLLNHLPVIGTLFAIALLAFAALRGNATLARAALWTFAVLGAVGIAVFLTGEPAEEAVEGLAGVSEGIMERHEEAALAATVALAAFGALSVAALLWFRRHFSRGAAALLLVLSLVPAGMMAWTANLGGQIRHSEIRSGATAALDAPAAGDEGEDEH